MVNFLRYRKMMLRQFLKLISRMAICLLLVGCISGQKATKPVSTQETSTIDKANMRIQEFTLGPGDEINLEVWRNDDLNTIQRISPDGMLSFPLAGDIMAAGVGLADLRETIREKLNKYLVNPQVSLSVVSMRSRKVFVLGEVNKPGVFQIDDSMSAMEAIAQAGGFTQDANLESVLLIRGNINQPELVSLNMEELFEEGSQNTNVSLKRGDIIYVHQSFISEVDRFFEHLRTILIPIVSLEAGIALWPIVKDVLGGEGGTRQILSVPAR